MLNAVAERDAGRTASELLLQPFTQLAPLAGNDALLDRYLDVLSTREAIHFEYHYQSSHLLSDWFNVSVIPVEDTLVIAYHNITQAKTTEETARPSALPEQTLTPSGSAITMYEAVSATDGQLAAFRAVRINECGLRLSGISIQPEPPRQPPGVTSLTRSSNSLFDDCAQVYRSGLAMSGKRYVTPLDNWQECTIAPAPGGVTVAYNEITTYPKLAEAIQPQLLDGILKSIPVGVAILNALRTSGGRISDFRLVRFNSAFKEALASTASDLPNQLLTQFVAGGTELGLLSRCIMCIETGSVHTFELSYNVQGQSYWYQASMTPAGDQLILTVTDITAAKQAQLAHHLQAELLQSISDHTPAGLVLWEVIRENSPEKRITDFRYRMTNRMNNELTGYTEADLLDKDLFTLFPRFKGTPLEMVLRETVETGRSQQLVFTHYLEGSDTWLDAQFNWVGNGVLMTFTNVTEQRKGQLAQKAQSDLLQVIVNAQPSGLVLYDPVYAEITDKPGGHIVDFTYALVNETQRRFAGLSDQQLIGKRLLPSQPSQQEKEFFDRLVEVAKTATAQEWLLPYNKDGTEGWFQASVMRHGSQVLFTFLDISALKRQKQDLEDANRDLSRSNENLQQFAYIASHDLQEPLRKIMAFGDLLTSQYADTLGEGVDYLHRMQAAASRMSILIRDLLALTRISNQRELTSSIDLGEVVRMAMIDLEMLIEETNVLMELDVLPTLPGDASQLGQLFQNLLSNALKFRREGVAPIIRISSFLVTAAQLPSAVKPARLVNEYYCIDVSDNGIGFEQRYADRIFQVFQRLHGKKYYAGTGIGLAICEKIVTNHGGAITVISQPGQGATFSIYLPA